MAGIGFVRDAVNNAKRNRDNLKNKSNFKKTYKAKTSNKKLIYKKATPEELEQYRLAFLEKQKRRRVKDIILFTSIVTILILVARTLFV